MNSETLRQILDPIVLSDARLVSIEAALSRYADRCIRLRTDRRNEELPFASEAVPWYPPGRWILDSSIRPSTFPQFAAADYYIQDAGSLLAISLLQVQPHQTICDLCAAPGGKASAILECLGHGGFLLANEPIRSRAEILRWSLERTGNPRFAISQLDPEELAQLFPGCFDSVLVDAPCSGQTLVSRGKRSDNAFDRAQIDHSAQRQRRILESAIRLLKPGGRLVYSTCTFATAENEKQIEWLIEHQPGDWKAIGPRLESLDSGRNALPFDRLIDLTDYRSPLLEGCYRLWPDEHRCAGAFAAAYQWWPSESQVVEEPSITSRDQSKRERSSSRSKSAKSSSELKEMQSALERIQSEIGEWKGLSLEYRNEVVWGIAEDVADWLKHPSLFGAELSVTKGKSQHPCQALATLKPEYFTPKRVADLQESLVQAFMRGEALPRLHDNDGWIVAQWNGKPIGWLKQISNRCNNFLPKVSRLQS